SLAQAKGKLREAFWDGETARRGNVFWRDPRRERNLDGPVGAGGSVLFVESCKPLDGKAVGNTDKRRPDPAVDERDSALDQASCNHLLGGTKRVENGEDFMSG